MPDTFKLLRLEFQPTFNDVNIETLLFNIGNPLIFNGDNNVVLLFNVVSPLILNGDIVVTLLFNVVSPDTSKSLDISGHVPSIPPSSRRP